MPAFPDPFLTASIYCDRRQDELLCKVVAPFWREFVQLHDPERLHYLWLVRYPKCGEHVKIRIHGPETHRDLLKERLGSAVAVYFTALTEPETREPRRDGMDFPPLDAEDYTEESYPDRTLLWTAYRRSHVSLGGKPFLDDNSYAAHVTSCLGRGCEIILEALKPDTASQYAHSLRQKILLKLLIGGLAVLGFSPEERAGYLAYHRDWLVRFALSRSDSPVERSAGLLSHFEERVTQMGLALQPLRRTALAEWRGIPRVNEEGGADAAWRRSLASLLEHLERFRDDPDYRLDPFAADPVYPPVFKIFHGMANQLGLGMLNEALAYHLLLRATAGEPLVQPEPPQGSRGSGVEA